MPLRTGKTYTLKLDTGERQWLINMLTLLAEAMGTKSPTRLALLARLEALEPGSDPAALADAANPEPRHSGTRESVKEAR